MRALGTTVAVVAVCAVAGCGGATEPTAANPPPRYASPSPSDPLLAQARRHGTVRVAVTLDVSWQPEVDLTDAEVGRQRTAIADAQDTLLAQLSPYRYRLVERDRSRPRLVLDADERATAHLLTSALVASVTATP